jgi:DNA-directed RNA polymerase omega subunit
MRDIDRTAGLTSQAAVEAIGNRYELVLVASQRMRELARGGRARVASRYGHGVTAMLEIEQGMVGREYLMREAVAAPRKRSYPD